MTQDIILDTTVRFIRANESNLQLAFRVEEALPKVRTELISDFFECVEKQLKETVKTTEGWEIRATGTEGLWIRNRHWKQLKVEEDSEYWWGVILFSEWDDKKSSSSPSICLGNIEKISHSVKEKVESEFRESIGKKPETEKTEGGEYLTHYLKGDLSDLNDLNFLKKMVNDKDREEITKDMADKLAKLADTVDRVLSNSG